MKRVAWQRGLLLLLILAAFALRLYRLDLQDVWWDEARNIDVAGRPFTQIATAGELDIHPPIYFYLLHGWMGLAGGSAFAIRFLSTWFGVLLVPLMAALGRRIGGRWAGWGAALAAACLPFLLGEAQEARMYTMVLAWLAAAALVLVGLARSETGQSCEPSPHSQVRTDAPNERPVPHLRMRHSAPCDKGQSRKWHWAAFALFSALALLTHYAAVFALAAVWGWAGFRALAAAPRDRAWSRLKPLLLAGLLTALLCLPGVPVALRQIPGYRNPNLVVPSAGGLLAELARVYSLGEHFALVLARPWMLALGLLLVGGWLMLVIHFVRLRRPPEQMDDPTELTKRGLRAAQHPERVDDSTRLTKRGLRAAQHPERVDDSTRLTKRDQSKEAEPSRSLASFDSRPQTAAAFRSGCSVGTCSDRSLVALALTWAVLPLVIYYFVISDRATSATRYISVALPGWLLLASLALAGWARLHRAAGVIASVALVALLVPGLRTDLTDTRFFRDDTRGLIAWLAANTDPARDIILVDQRYPFGFYYDRWNNITEGFPPAEPADQTPAQYVFADLGHLGDRLTQLTTGRERVFWVRWFESDTDPRGAIPFMLEKFGTRAGERAFRGYTLTWYAIAAGTRFELAPPLNAMQVTFDDQVRLEGAAFGGHGAGTTSTLDETRAPSTPADKPVWAVVRWSALPGASAPASALGQGVKATLVLEDDNGLVVARDDRPLLNDRHLAPSQWPAGDAPLGVFLLHPEPATAPGTYTLKLAVYDPATLAQLPATGTGASVAAASGTFVTLGQLQLTRATQPPDIAALPLDAQPPLAWRGLRLLGRGPLSASLSPGDRLDVDLYWQAEAAPLPDFAVLLKLQPAGATGAPPIELNFREIANGYATMGWDAGEIVRDRQVWQLPPEMANGSYRLLLNLLTGDAAESPAVELGQVDIAGRSHNFTAPAVMEHASGAAFGALAQLLGYDGPVVANRAVTLTLYWQALAASANPHNVSVQLLDAGGVLVAQRDQPPGDGAYPTTGWVAGEVLADAYRVELPPDLPAGTYTVIVKLYDATTFAPLAVTLPDGSAAGEYLPLGELELGG